MRKYVNFVAILAVAFLYMGISSSVFAVCTNYNSIGILPGKIVYNNTTYTDYCSVDKKNVIDYYCVGGIGRLLPKSCGSGSECNNGICITSVVTPPVNCANLSNQIVGFINSNGSSIDCKSSKYNSIYDTNVELQLNGTYIIKPDGVIDASDVLSSGKMTDAQCQTQLNSSKDFCSVTPSIKIISPNGGEVLSNGEKISVKWIALGLQKIDSIKLRAYPEGKEYDLGYNVVNDGEEVFDMPNHIPTKAPYIIEAESFIGNLQILDKSDNYFTITSGNDNGSLCYDFKSNLFYGSTGKDVSALQNILKKEGFESFIINRKDKDGVFGLGTFYALKAFQDKYKDEILTPYRLRYSTGNVGPSTIKKLNSLYSCGNNVKMSKPIESLNCLNLSAEIINFINKYGSSIKCNEANFDSKYDVNNDCAINASDSLANSNKCNAINNSLNTNSGALLEDLQKQVASLADAIAKLLSQLGR
jgi:hypothetical protein